MGVIFFKVTKVVTMMWHRSWNQVSEWKLRKPMQQNHWSSCYHVGQMTLWHNPSIPWFRKSNELTNFNHPPHEILHPLCPWRRKEHKIKSDWITPAKSVRNKAKSVGYDWNDRLAWAWCRMQNIFSLIRNIRGHSDETLRKCNTCLTHYPFQLQNQNAETDVTRGTGWAFVEIDDV
jgi:hypothetical protein